MMKHRWILLICVFNTLMSFAIGPSDTLFFNKKWRICQRSDAKYYRLIFRTDSIYIIHDFYLNGTLQMEAICSSADPEIKNGKCTYYDKKGRKTSQGCIEIILRKVYGSIGEKTEGILLWWMSVRPSRIFMIV